MPRDFYAPVSPADAGVDRRQMPVVARRALLFIVVAVLVFLAIYNLRDYPATWFDEGSHLQVPKTLVRFGVYADYSSEGFRYYGPTIGIGPTVMLPIAAAFRVFGVGLLQARLVMSLYLLAAIGAFYLLARQMGTSVMAWVAVALLISSRSIGLLEYGRQVLGEVPGFFFLATGLLLWFAAWEKAGWARLVVVGVLLGLAVITKYQYLLFLAPTLAIAWLANIVYYRAAPQLVFVVPGLVTAVCFALWQIYLTLYLGPATASDNWALLRETAAGAAMTFDRHLISLSLEQIQSRVTYMGALFPVLVYGVFLALPRRREGQLWSILLTLVAINLVWYVFASIGWVRYAFLAMALASVFVARFFYDITDGFQLRWTSLREELRQSGSALPKQALHWSMVAWLVVMIAAPLGKTVSQMVSTGSNPALAMAAYLDQNVPQDALIETWEPEMGFLTNHTYHFPPASLLSKAVDYVFRNGIPPADFYDAWQAEYPDYVLVGDFGWQADLYSYDILNARYDAVAKFGNYELYTLRVVR